MPTYTLSSTDPDRYSRIRVSLPIEMSTQLINICVSSFTANANFELPSKDDFIEFSIGDTVKKLKFKSTSKLSSPSLPYVFQDLLNEQDIPITVQISDTDCLIFSSTEPFQIKNMSYNAKLVTGFYCTKNEEFPLVANPYETQTEKKASTEIVNVRQVTANNLNLREGYTKELKVVVSPDKAYGYTTEYEIEDETMAKINFSNASSCEIEGVKEGETNITIKVKNANTSENSQPDFTVTAQIEVMKAEKIEISEVTLPQEIDIKIKETRSLYPQVNPSWAGYYIESWYSENNAVALVSSGVVTGIGEGNTVIHCNIINRSPEINQEFDIKCNVHVKTNLETVTNYEIRCMSVGYLLSTPILYLIGVVGSPVFSNQMDNSQRMNSGCMLMVLNNSFSSSFPIVQQSELVVPAYLNYASDFTVFLVDANFREVKLLNPFYITVIVEPIVDQPMGSGVMIN